MKSFFYILCFFSAFSAVATECESMHTESVYKPRYAKLFKISYYKDFKIIESVNDKFIVTNVKLDCTSKLPVFTANVQRFVATSTTHLPFLKTFGLEKSLIGFQGVNYIYDQKLRSQKIKNINYQMNAEALISLKADLLMAYSANISSDSKIADLRKLNIPMVLNRDFQEQHPLARAEWVVFQAAFFSKDKEAQKNFSEIEANYNLIKKMNNKTTPMVLVGDIQNGKWATCGGLSDLAILIKDAGGELLLNKKSPETQYFPLETVLTSKTNPQIWLTQNTWTDRKKIKEDPRYNRFNSIPAYNNNKLVNSDGFNDYWETGLSRPDLLLKDLHTLFHPEKNLKAETIWYKQL